MLTSKLMKQRSTTPVSSKSLATKGMLVAGAILMATAAPVSMFVKPVTARDFAAEIQAVQNQINQYQAEAGRLAGEAKTLETELARINSEKAALQAQIDAKQIEYDKLVAEITENERKIAQLQDYLGDVLAKLHVGGEVSPLEMLASSNNISEFLDGQARRESMRDDLTDTIEEIDAIKKQLEMQRVEIQRVLDDQKAQREALSAKEAEQQRLVNETRGQEAAFQALSAKSQADKQKLLDAQASYFLSLRAKSSMGGVTTGDPSKGGYPAQYANANYYAYVPDKWGMYARQCVSYTAWKVEQKTGHMPYWGGRGNAWQWAFSGYHDGGGNKVNYATPYYHQSNAERAGIPTSSEPRPGSVAVKDANPAAGDQWGHVAWVESVSGNQVYVSQYNYFNAGGSGWGHYSEMWVDKSFFQKYIYF